MRNQEEHGMVRSQCSASLWLLFVSDEIRHAYYTKRNNISNERIVLDNQKSLEKRSRTVWEFVADKWNDIEFEPETEVFEKLHSESSCPIKIPHHKVALLSLATPDKVQERSRQ